MSIPIDQGLVMRHAFNSIFPLLLTGFALVTAGMGCGANGPVQDKLPCSTIHGLDSLLRPGRIILLGEIHGTQEAPAYVGQMACHMLRKQIPVIVGLELPREEESVVRAFLQSEGSEADQLNILQLPFWAKEYQDGRTSQAMFDLLETLRQFRTVGGEIDILLIDHPSSDNRDIAMAARIIQTAKEAPASMMVILTGNLHSIIYEDSGYMGSYITAALGKDRVLSLKQTFTGGSAWVDTGGSPGPVRFGGEGLAWKGIIINPDLYEYQGSFEMDSIHASRPAKEMVAN
ncbi:MAG: hypothetical protein AAF587_44310 [Bacteroidota bacterium]